MEELNRELMRANRNNTLFSIISMDIDNLKIINDRYGHNYGDLFLKEFGLIIQATCRKTDIPARIGGDEFILLNSESDSNQAYALAQRILSEANARKIDIKGEQISLSVSIGIAHYPTHGTTLDELLNKADKAMYEAKKNGKNQIQISG